MRATDFIVWNTCKDLGAFCVEFIFEQVFGRPGRTAGSQIRLERAHRIDGDAAPQAAGALGAEQVTLTDQVLFMASYNLEANFAELLGTNSWRHRFVVISCFPAPLASIRVR